MIGEIADQTIHSSDHPWQCPSQPRYPHHGPPQTHPGPCPHLCFPALYHVNKYTRQGGAERVEVSISCSRAADISHRPVLPHPSPPTPYTLTITATAARSAKSRNHHNTYGQTTISIT